MFVAGICSDGCEVTRMVKSNSEPDGAQFRHAGNMLHILTLPERFTTGGLPGMRET
jgi:hypothetical protein